LKGIRNDDACDTIYINTNDITGSEETETREALCVNGGKRNTQHYTVVKVAILQRIRSVKESEELDLIQQACTITEKDSEEFFLRETNVMITKSKLNLFMNSLATKGFAYNYWLRKQC
jgi:Xaa-Pro aminopeptidase